MQWHTGATLWGWGNRFTSQLDFNDIDNMTSFDELHSFCFYKMFCDIVFVLRLWNRLLTYWVKWCCPNRGNDSNTYMNGLKRTNFYSQTLQHFVIMSFHCYSLYITDPIKTDEGTCCRMRKELKKSLSGSPTKLLKLRMKIVEIKKGARKRRKN